MHRRPLPFVCQRRFWERRSPQLPKFSKVNAMLAQKSMLPKGKCVTMEVPSEVFEHNGYTHTWPKLELHEDVDFRIKFGKPLKNGRISKNTKEFLVKDIVGEQVQLYMGRGKYEEARLLEGYAYFRSMRSEKTAGEILAEFRSAVKDAESRLSCRHDAELKERRNIEAKFRKSKCNVIGGKLQCEDCCQRGKDTRGCSLQLMANAKETLALSAQKLAPRIKKLLSKERYLPDLVIGFLEQMKDWRGFKHALRAIKEGFYAVVRVPDGGNRDGRIVDFKLMVINPDKNYHTIITNKDGKRVSARTLTYSVAKLDKLKELPAFILPVKTRANALRKRRRSTRIWFTYGTDDTAGW